MSLKSDCSINTDENECALSSNCLHLFKKETIYTLTNEFQVSKRKPVPPYKFQTFVLHDKSEIEAIIPKLMDIIAVYISLHEEKQAKHTIFQTCQVNTAEIDCTLFYVI